ncbi:MAG: hypothetical protein DMG27_08270 [Acidobacteria bacterium]|nr:MAG: hypothetical protein DMG27_08270 [Acidobacteriota bacterium]
MKVVFADRGRVRPARLCAWLTLVVWSGGCATKAEAVQPLLVPQAPVARREAAPSAPKAASAKEKAPARASAFEREFQSAAAAYEAKDYARAQRQIEPLAARLPDSFEVNELMGLVYAGQGQDEKAKRFLENAVRLKPDSAAARTNLAVNLARLGKKTLAEAEFKKAAELEPDSFDVNHNLGEFYVRASRLPAAIPYLKRAQSAALSNPPANPAASYENGYDLALAWAETAHYAEARAEIRTQLQKRDTAELHNLLGEVEEKGGNYLAAESEYERAAHMEPSEKNIFDWGGELLLHQALDPAVEVFSRGVERYPRSAKMQIGLGLAFYARAQYDDAVKALSLSTDLEPSDPRPYLFLAKAYNVSTTQTDEVTARLRRFAEREPRNAQAQFYYAMSLWKGKRDQEQQVNLGSIQALLKSAIKLDPAFPDAHLELGALYANQRSYPDAIREYERAIRLDPSLPDAHYRLAQAFVRTKDKDRAREQFTLYERLHQQQVADTERRRREIKQFMFTLRSSDK